MRVDRFDPGDLIIAVGVVDGREVATRLERRAGEPLRLEGDPDRGFALFRLRPDEVVGGDGLPLDGETFAALEPCLEPGCGPCTVPTFVLPYMALPGDTCRLPPTVPGAWIDADGRCTGDEGGAVCPPGSSDGAIGGVRARLRLRAPGPPPPAVVPGRSLDGRSLRMLGPADPPVVVHAWTEGHGLILGAGDDNLVAAGDDGVQVVRLFDLDVRPVAVAPDRDRFLLLGRAAYGGSEDSARLFEIRLDAGRPQPPRPLSLMPRTQPFGLLVAADVAWVYGTEFRLTGFEYSLEGCASPRGCIRIPLERCTAGQATPLDLLEGPAGLGIFAFGRGLFVGRLDPGTAEPWTCVPLPDEIPTADGAAEHPVRELRAVRLHAGALYACAHEDPIDECSSSRPLVLTATAADQPRFRVLWAGPQGLSCGDLLPAPSGEGVRARFGRRLFDVRPDGTAVEALRVEEAWGLAAGAERTLLLPGGTLLLLGPGERVHRVTEGEPELLVGSPSLDLPDWRGGAAGADGALWLLARDRGAARLDSEDRPIRFAEDGLSGPRVALAADVNRGDVLVVGEDGRYAVFEGGDPARRRTGSLPERLGRASGAATMGPAGFVVLGAGASAARIPVDGPAEPLPVRFDDPATQAPEVEPVPAAGRCGAPPESPWLSAAGGEGAAWASGRNGLLVRFTAAGGVRRALPTSGSLRALFVPRPDVVRFAGSAIENLIPNLQLWSLELDEGWGRGDAELLHGPSVSFGPADVRFSRALALLADEPSGATPVLLAEGLLPSVGAPLRYRRVPFVPRGAVSSTDGLVVFFGAQGRLAALRR